MVRPPRIASRWLARTCSGILVGPALAATVLAQADAADAPELRWEAPAGCPAQEEVRGELDQVLAKVDPARRQALRLRARARVTETAPERFSLDLEITTSEGMSERHVEAVTCAELADATTLLISMVDPAAAAEAEHLRAAEQHSELEPTPTPEPEPEAIPEPAPEPEPEPEAIPESEPNPASEAAISETATDSPPPTPPGEGGARPQVQGLLGAELALGRAGLPSFGAGLGLQLGLLRRHLRGELFARYHLPRTQTLTGLDELGATVRYQLGVGGLRGCGLGRVGQRLELFGCLGAELGAMRGEGINLPVSTAHTALWAALLVTPGLAAQLTPRLALVARGDLGVALARPRFAVRNYGDAHRAPAVSFVFGLGLELRLPPGPALRARRGGERKNPERSGMDRESRGQSPREAL